MTCAPFFFWHWRESLGRLIRSPTLDRPKAEFSGFAQGDGLVTPPDFVSMIGTLFTIAPCGCSAPQPWITPHNGYGLTTTTARTWAPSKRSGR